MWYNDGEKKDFRIIVRWVIKSKEITRFLSFPLRKNFTVSCLDLDTLLLSKVKLRQGGFLDSSLKSSFDFAIQTLEKLPASKCCNVSLPLEEERQLIRLITGNPVLLHIICSGQKGLELHQKVSSSFPYAWESLTLSDITAGMNYWAAWIKPDVLWPPRSSQIPHLQVNWSWGSCVVSFSSLMPPHSFSVSSLDTEWTLARHWNWRSSWRPKRVWREMTRWRRVFLGPAPADKLHSVPEGQHPSHHSERWRAHGAHLWPQWLPRHAALHLQWQTEPSLQPQDSGHGAVGVWVKSGETQ